ncbi:glycosyltransferase, partial [Psychrobacter sp. TAE2020]|uniref:glycosyltransferase n=1 Tax=Psychrobacter sp. TAE2020 TaxID=2846762 RepID=UPI001C0FDF0D
EFMKLLITRFATSNIAVSEKAAISLFGKKWPQNSKNKIIYCGVDYNKFKNIKNSIDYHEMLNIPKDSIVIGHVGRFEEPKNHKFILDVFSKLSSLDSKYYLVLVGDGSLKVDIESIANQSNVSSRIKFMGNRSDIPGIMSGLFDVFVFPSLWEGLPLTLVEAQFANLLCIVSNNVTKECNLGLCKYLNINETSNWVTCLSDLPNVETEQSFELSEFNIERSNIQLFKEYLKNEY